MKTKHIYLSIAYFVLSMNYVVHSQTLTDIQGNVYKIVTIGEQTWMAENLKVTKFKNGNNIPTTSPASKDISLETSPTYQWASDNQTLFPLSTHGRLYTGYVAADSRGVCPTGWHVPISTDWSKLVGYCGSEALAGGKLKEVGLTYWAAPNTGATNSTGFTAYAMPGRESLGSQGSVATDTYFWSASTSTLLTNPVNRAIKLYSSQESVLLNTYQSRNYGAPIRCLSDTIYELNMGFTSPSCGEDDATATVTPSGGISPFTYSWSTGETTKTISGLVAQTYTVTVTDKSGGTAFGYIEITDSPKLDFNINSENPNCNASNEGAAYIEITAGVAPFSYSWSNNETNDTITSLTVGDYTITVTDQRGCTTSKSVNISQPLFSTDVSNTEPVCSSDSNATATATPSHDGPYTYLWSNSDTSNVITGLAGNDYSVTVTNAKGCTASNKITIVDPTPLVLNLTSTTPTCFGQNQGTATVSTSGGHGTYRYVWSTSSLANTITNLTAATYTVSVTDAGSCTASKEVIITEPDLLKADLTKTNPLCMNSNTGTVSVTATGGTSPFTYLWSNQQTSTQISGLGIGTYNVTVTDSKGCTASKYTALVNPTNNLSVIPTNTSPQCKGDSSGTASVVITGGVQPYSYSWSNSEVSDTISGLSAGFYFVTVTDGNGCTGTSTASITDPMQLILIVSKTDATGSCNNGTAKATVVGGVAPYNYSWNTNPTQITETATGLAAPKMYVVTIEDAQKCVKFDSIFVDCATGINNSLTRNKLNIFPNPVNHTLYVEFVNLDNSEVELTLTNVQGKEVIKKKIGNNLTGTFIHEIDMSQLSNQIYFVKIVVDQRQIMRKVSKF